MLCLYHRSVTPTGRNAPCPCSSGRKFKHCCLPKQQIRTAAAAYTGQERTNAFAKVLRFARRDEFGEDTRLGQTLFWAGRLDVAPAARRRELEADEQCLSAFLHWFVFDYDLLLDEDRRTIAQRFLAAKGDTLTPGERTYLERLSASCIRPYEVVEVRPDQGLGLRDLWTDEVVQVSERLATRQLARWDIMAVRVIQGPEGANVLEGVPYLYPAEAQDAILAELRRHESRLRRELDTGDPGALFKRVGMVFHHLWLDHVALRPMPTIVTAEGEPVTLAKVVFDVTDRARVSAALESHPQLELQDDGSFAWHEASDPFTRILGTFVLDERRLTLETMSESRAERGRAFAEQLLGDAVRFRAVRHENLEHALARSPRREPAPSPELPPELEREVVTQFYEQHYRSWLDEPVPALDGRTPRHAARLKTARPKLVALLKQLENHMERERGAGRLAVDLGWMWGELGLERP